MSSCDRCTAYVYLPWRDQDRREWLCTRCASVTLTRTPCRICHMAVMVADAAWTGAYGNPIPQHVDCGAARRQEFAA